MDNKVCPIVIGRGTEVYKHQLISPVIVNKPGGRIDIEGSAADNEHVRMAYVMDSPGDNILVQSLLIEDDVGPDDSAAGAKRQTLAVVYIVCVVDLSASGAIGPEDAAVELKHVFAAGILMEAVYILGDDRLQFALLLKLTELQVGFTPSMTSFSLWKR